MKNIPTAISIEPHRYSQVTSAEAVLLLTTVTRIIETMITIIVREKIPMRASFLPQETCTFHNIIIGKVITVYVQLQYTA